MRRPQCGESFPGAALHWLPLSRPYASLMPVTGNPPGRRQRAPLHNPRPAVMGSELMLLRQKLLRDAAKRRARNP